MRLQRRECLKLGAAGAGAALAGCSKVVNRLTAPALPETVSVPTHGTEPNARLLNRAAYGPRPGDVQQVARMGRDAYVESQLNPDETDPQILRFRLAGLEALQIRASELGDLPRHEVLRQLQMAAILRAVYSPHQLLERMVEFWSNHFNIYTRKADGAYYKPTDELRVIRKHALGSFPELLRASAHSPAMLMYLDNQQNRRKDAKGAGANENYARELMELHTLGVHGGYTQKDVQEVARCLTGWTVDDGFLHARGTFRFDPAAHDNGRKVVLGQVIAPGGGEKDGDHVLDILTKHPSTARFISHKLCRYFLGAGDAADRWTDRTAETYLATDGDIKSMLRPMLLSDDLLHGPPIMKRPFDFAVSALRALNANTDGDLPTQDHLAHMGQPLYQWPMPDGYPDKTAAWTGSLLARWNFATNLASGGIGGTSVDLPGLMRIAGASTSDAVAGALIELIMARPAGAASNHALRTQLASHVARLPANDKKRQAPIQCAALLLASPEFQWR